MEKQYKHYLEDRLSDLYLGLDIAKKDILDFTKENGPYFLKGALSPFFSLLPFQQRHELPINNFSKFKTIYYTSILNEMKNKEKNSAGVGFLSSLGCYYGIGMNYANFNELLGFQALILVPFSMQYVFNCQPKTIRK